MKQHIEMRVIDIADYIIDNHSTVRATAKNFDVSKSTVHKDLTERLPEIDKQREKMVRKILGINLLERHIRGGQATKRKFKKTTD